MDQAGSLGGRVSAILKWGGPPILGRIVRIRFCFRRAALSWLWAMKGYEWAMKVYEEAMKGLWRGYEGL